MRGSAVAVSPARLKVTFVALGAVLLCGLFVLSWFVQERLDEARRDREEMVASRVFDEMEREISAFLEGESERPHYDHLRDTNPETWAPFVVAYFSGAGPDQARAPHIVADDGTTRENRRRAQWAIDQAEQFFVAARVQGESPATALQPRAVIEEPREQSSEEAPGPAKKDIQQEAPAPSPQSKATGSQIIQQLNRAPQRRKSKRPAPAEEQRLDDFSDYESAF